MKSVQKPEYTDNFRISAPIFYSIDKYIHALNGIS